MTKTELIQAVAQRLPKIHDSFDTCRQAARFIAEREHYATGSIEYYFGKRREEVHGWKINYQR